MLVCDVCLKFDKVNHGSDVTLPSGIKRHLCHTHQKELLELFKTVEIMFVNNANWSPEHVRQLNPSNPNNTQR